ncbi:hypothetical protein D3C75_851410 [compost metagenome]
MSETLWFFLPDIVYFHFRGTLNFFKQLQLAVFQQPGLQFEGVVEVIFDRALSFTGNNDNVLDTGSNGFFHDILNGRFVDDWKHFLRHGLCRRQEARS